jgi:hypothetical protein
MLIQATSTARDRRLTVYSLKATVLEKPGEPEDENSPADKRIWEKEIDK